MAQDPVCGMSVNPGQAAGRMDHAGTTYYFCSTACFKAFQANPDAYIKASDPGGSTHHVHGKA